MSRRPPLKSPKWQKFVGFYLEHAAELVKAAGYVPLPESAYALVKTRFETKTAGSVFEGKEAVGVKLEELLAKESK